MALNQDRLHKIARYNERIAEKRFKKLGFSVDWLDMQGPRKRPEFMVSDSDGPILACEVKTVFSAGFLGDRDAHASTQDPALLGSGVFSVPVNFDQMNADLVDAIEKYHVLSEDHPEYERLPLFVLFFFDFFADNFDMFPSRMGEFPEVSGIGKIDVNLGIKRVAESMPLEELGRIIDSGSMKGFPPPAKEIRVLENELANNPLPRHFVDACVGNHGADTV